MPPFYGGVPDPRNAALYITWNCGKLGAAVDLSTERGREVVGRLAEWSDVVLESVELELPDTDRSAHGGAA